VRDGGPYYLRTWALKKAERWMLDHNEHSEGLRPFPGHAEHDSGAQALRPFDYHPVLQKIIKELEKFYIDGERGRDQPAFSPIWEHGHLRWLARSPNPDCAAIMRRCVRATAGF